MGVPERGRMGGPRVAGLGSTVAPRVAEGDWTAAEVPSRFRGPGEPDEAPSRCHSGGDCSSGSC
eukprot:9277376-Alexandrium_andersonii.AAC.1